MQVSLADVWAARNAIRHVTVRTPTLHMDGLDRQVGSEVWVKAECLQRTGSFKFRGAFNKIASLTAAERQRGVITASAGNNALGVAQAAVAYGVPECVVVMPETAVTAKVEAVQALGVTVLLHGRDSAALFAKVSELQEQRGYIFAHPFDDPAVIAGQGTVGLELLEDTPTLDYVVVPTSGGGLLSGILVALKGLSPATKVIGVQPESCAGMILSLKAGSLQEAPPPLTIADGLTARKPGTLNFALTRDLADDVVTVTDADIRRAMGLLYKHAKLVVEGAGAAALANVMTDGRFHGKRVAVIASGGNVSPALAAEVFQSL